MSYKPGHNIACQASRGCFTNVSQALQLNICNLCRCYSSCRHRNLCAHMSFIPKCHDISTHIVVDKSTSWPISPTHQKFLGLRINFSYFKINVYCNFEWDPWPWDPLMPTTFETSYEYLLIHVQYDRKWLTTFWNTVWWVQTCSMTDNN